MYNFTKKPDSEKKKIKNQPKHKKINCGMLERLKVKIKYNKNCTEILMKR